MKHCQFVLSGALILLGTSALHAAGMVSPDSCPTGTLPVGLSFSFNADSLGGTSLFPHAGGLLDCMFNNVSGQNFFSLAVTTALPPGTTPSDFGCVGNLFNLCNVSLNTAGNMLIFNFGLRPSVDRGVQGIPNGTEFALDLGTNAFAPNQAFFVAANGAPFTIPEPASAILILSGAAMLFGWRRTWRHVRRGSAI